MKHLLLPMLLLATTAGAQLPYDLTVLDQPYEPLTEATALEFDQFDLYEGWDDPEFSVQLGFDFDFSGQSISAWDQVGLGVLMMGTSIDDKSGLPLLQGVIPPFQPRCGGHDRMLCTNILPGLGTPNLLEPGSSTRRHCSG